MTRGAGYCPGEGREWPVLGIFFRPPLNSVSVLQTRGLTLTSSGVSGHGHILSCIPAGMRGPFLHPWHLSVSCGDRAPPSWRELLARPHPLSPAAPRTAPPPLGPLVSEAGGPGGTQAQKNWGQTQRRTRTVCPRRQRSHSAAGGHGPGPAGGWAEKWDVARADSAASLTLGKGHSDAYRGTGGPRGQDADRSRRKPNAA